MGGWVCIKAQNVPLLKIAARAALEGGVSLGRYVTEVQRKKLLPVFAATEKSE